MSFTLHLKIGIVLATATPLSCGGSMLLSKLRRPMLLSKLRRSMMLNILIRSMMLRCNGVDYVERINEVVDVEDV